MMEKLTVKDKPNTYRITFTYTVDVPMDTVKDIDEAYGVAFSEFVVDPQCAEVNTEEIFVKEDK